MKKNYLAPELNIIALDLRDVITHSLATGNDNGTGGTAPGGSIDAGGTGWFTNDGKMLTPFGTWE